MHQVFESASATVIERLLNLNTEAASWRGSNGDLLLHRAVRAGRASDVIRLVLSYFPDAMHALSGSDGLTPIQCAIKTKSSLDCIKLLHCANAQFPQSLCEYAVLERADADVFDYLLSVYPGEVNKSLIKTALVQRREDAIVDKIIQALPANTDDHSTPTGCDVLIQAITSAYSLDMLRKLITAFPNIAKEPAAHLPLVHVLHHQVSLPVLALILSVFPAATLAVTKNVALWDQTIRDSESSQLTSSTIDKLWTGNPTFATTTDGVVAVCLTALNQDKAIFTDMMKVRELHVSTAEEIIHQFMNAHPEWTYLCRQAAEQTTSQIRTILNSYLYFLGRYEQQHVIAPLHCSDTAVVIEFKDHAVDREYAGSYNTYRDQGFKAAMATLHIEATHEHEKNLAKFINPSSANLSPEEPATANIASTDKYQAFCEGTFGKTRKVVIKFMCDEVQFEREKSVRATSELHERFVVPLLKEVQGCENVLHVKQEFKFGLVMPAANRSLQAVYDSERPLIANVRKIMLEIGLALQHCHSKGIVHGDLKMLNVLRVGESFRLIDLDSACKVDTDFHAAKFSSGVLPPELFAQLTVPELQIYSDYWAAEKSSLNSSLWRKIEPRECTVYNNGISQKQYFVVRTYRTNADGSPDATKPLPYPLVRASPAVDIWAFGLMLFNLISGKPLLAVNRDCDIVDGDKFRQAASWSDQSIKTIIASLLNSQNLYLAIDLVTCFLVPCSERRSAVSISKHLEHPFFSDQRPDITAKIEDTLREQSQVLEAMKLQNQRIDDKTRRIEHVSNTILQQIKDTERVMLRAMFEAVDVTVPSSFIIVNQKLRETVSEEEDPSAMELAESWTNKLAAVAQAISDLIDNGRTSVIEEAVAQLTNQTLYLYLIDEYTKEPVVNHSKYPAYPIEITKPHEFVCKVLPLMRLGLTAVNLLNGASMLARCLGYPVPCVPENMMSAAKQAVGNLSKKSSVEEFDVVQRVLDSEALNSGVETNAADARSDVKSVRGATLREFARLLAIKDENSTFAGLCRVATEDGSCCWTHPDNVEAIVSVGVARTSTQQTQTDVVEETFHSDMSSDSVANATDTVVAPAKQAESLCVETVDSKEAHEQQREATDTLLLITEIPSLLQSSRTANLVDSIDTSRVDTLAQEVDRLGQELAELKEINARQRRTIDTLVEDIPSTLRSMSTDIVHTVSSAAAAKKGCQIC